jgi:23S rRNA (cytidine1920-2'-O)/16S rRNA (cytidine1409-2'-O)-methyltransferase
LLVDRGLVASRERAQALILAGRVLAGEQKISKSGANVDSEIALRILGNDLRYVSRGGFKLERALEHWKINLTGLTCLDVGTSTGGFTDCMLQHGAAKVIAVDTGYGQIDAKLRGDARVRLLEKTNARYLDAETVGERVQFVSMDVSFISATLVLPAVIGAAFDFWRPPVKSTQVGHPAEELLVLVKPQFEVGRELVGKGGIVRDEAAQMSAVEKVRRTVSELGGHDVEVIDSPILGTEGNREFLLHGRFG